MAIDQKRVEKLNKILYWKSNKPRKDADWAEDVKEESLHVKFGYQLQEMEESHEKKVPKVEKDLDRVTRFPDYRKFELEQRFSAELTFVNGLCEGKTLEQWVDDEYESEKLYYEWKVEKLKQSVERIKKERELRGKGFLEVIEVPKEHKLRKADDVDALAIRAKGSRKRVPIGTTYYIDGTNGNDANDGLGTGGANAWLNLDQFTENARSAGDKVIVRRVGGGAIDNGSDLNFTSDGTISNPIIIEADFDNAWSDRVDLSATATATLTFGSKTVTFSSAINGVLAAGDWIYASGDDNRLFAYEVVSVSGAGNDTVTLYLPYKGGQAGSGKTMYNMQDNPIWNTAAGNFQWNFDTDNFWKVQGIHIRGTDVNGNVELDTSIFHEFLDCTFEGNATTSVGILSNDDTATVYVRKCRFYNHSGVNFSIDTTYGNPVDTIARIYDTLFDTGTSGVHLAKMSQFYLYDSEFKNHTTANVSANSITSGDDRGGGSVNGRNNTFSSATKVASLSVLQSGKFEDYNNTVSSTLSNNGLLAGADIIQSETTTVRSGGSNKSVKVTPTTSLTTIWDFNALLVFELPIYATTSSKTYEIYFRPSATGDWTNDPTASELWIELEAWGHASNNFRKITKSTGTIDMNGSTAWQALSVTVAPAQAGVAYLRCWYGKTKEGGKTNVFYVDPIPVIT